MMNNIMHEELEQFFLRNMGDYIKHSDVSDKLIQKYTGILPEPILEVWRRTGFGIYEHGFIQFVDPEEWEFVFEYIDLINDPAIVFAITALGDLLIWEGMGLGGQGNHVNLVFVNDCDDEVKSSEDIGYFLGEELDTKQDAPEHEDFGYFLEEFRAQNYHKVKGTLPPLKYGQCYGYAPLPALGAKKSWKSLQVVDAKTYVDMIGQAVGKIIDLSD